MAVKNISEKHVESNISDLMSFPTLRFLFSSALSCFLFHFLLFSAQSILNLYLKC